MDEELDSLNTSVRLALENLRRSEEQLFRARAEYQDAVLARDEEIMLRLGASGIPVANYDATRFVADLRGKGYDVDRSCPSG